jgi:hypothetical protein
LVQLHYEKLPQQNIQFLTGCVHFCTINNTTLLHIKIKNNIKLDPQEGTANFIPEQGPEKLQEHFLNSDEK